MSEREVGQDEAEVAQWLEDHVSYLSGESDAVWGSQADSVLDTMSRAASLLRARSDGAGGDGELRLLHEYERRKLAWIDALWGRWICEADKSEREITSEEVDAAEHWLDTFVSPLIRRATLRAPSEATMSRQEDRPGMLHRFAEDDRNRCKICGERATHAWHSVETADSPSAPSSEPQFSAASGAEAAGAINPKAGAGLPDRLAPIAKEPGVGALNPVHNPGRETRGEPANGRGGELPVPFSEPDTIEGGRLLWAAGELEDMAAGGLRFNDDKTLRSVAAYLKAQHIKHLSAPHGEPAAWVVEMPLYNPDNGEFDGPLAMDGTLHLTRATADADATKYHGRVVPL